MLSPPAGGSGSSGLVIFNLVCLVLMSDELNKPPSSSDLLRSSSLYRYFQAQRAEILKHKWYESERAGCDIGFDRALTDWTIKYRSEWLKSRRSGLKLNGSAAS